MEARDKIRLEIKRKRNRERMRVWRKKLRVNHPAKWEAKKLRDRERMKEKRRLREVYHRENANLDKWLVQNNNGDQKVYYQLMKSKLDNKFKDDMPHLLTPEWWKEKLAQLKKQEDIKHSTNVPNGPVNNISQSAVSQNYEYITFFKNIKLTKISYEFYIFGEKDHYKLLPRFQ